MKLVNVFSTMFIKKERQQSYSSLYFSSPFIKKIVIILTIVFITKIRQPSLSPSCSSSMLIKKIVTVFTTIYQGKIIIVFFIVFFTIIHRVFFILVYRKASHRFHIIQPKIILETFLVTSILSHSRRGRIHCYYFLNTPMETTMEIMVGGSMVMDYARCIL